MSRLKLVKVGDRAKVLYSQKLEELFLGETSSTVQKAIKPLQTVEMGWALKAKRKRTAFTKRQKEYMTEKFNIGKISGCKIDPNTAADDMRLSGRFERVEFLTGQQIGSFFSRLAQKDKKMDEVTDLQAAEKEDTKMKLNKVIISYLDSNSHAV